MMSRRSGATLVEVVTAAAIGVLAIGASLAVYTQGMGTWFRGQLRISVESGSREMVRTISDRLREAMEVTIDANGQGVSYRVPVRDVSGIYAIPLTWDGVNRRIYHSNGSIILQEGGSSRTIGTHVILTDPGQTGSPSYAIFQPNGPGFVRRLSVKIVTRQQDEKGNVYLGRKREWITPRNTPQ
jgi:hypothetical protein